MVGIADFNMNRDFFASLFTHELGRVRHDTRQLRRRQRNSVQPQIRDGPRPLAIPGPVTPPHEIPLHNRRGWLESVLLLGHCLPVFLHGPRRPRTPLRVGRNRHVLPRPLHEKVLDANTHRSPPPVPEFHQEIIRRPFHAHDEIIGALAVPEIHDSHILRHAPDPHPARHRTHRRQHQRLRNHHLVVHSIQFQPLRRLRVGQQCPHSRNHRPVVHQILHTLVKRHI